MLIDSLWAIRNSHGRSSKSRALAPQRGERAGHRALQRVLGVVIVAQERPAVAIQRLVVLLIDLRERRPAAPRPRGGEGYALSPVFAFASCETHLPNAFLPCLPEPYLCAKAARVSALSPRSSAHVFAALLRALAAL